VKRFLVAAVVLLVAVWWGLRVAKRSSTSPLTSPLTSTSTSTRLPIRLPRATARQDATVAAGEFGGRVLSTVDGHGIARAALTFLHEGAAISTESDGDGRFRVTAKSAGAYELASAAAAGFAPFEPQLGHSPVTLWARAGVRLDDVTIFLTPAIALTVLVEDSAGKPIAGAEVRVFDEMRGAAEIAATLTDGKGRAQVTAEAMDVVEARHAGYKRARAYVNTAVEASQRLTLRLAAGGEAARVGIGGRVVDRRGLPVDGALVEAWSVARDDGDEPARAQTLSGVDGRFALADLDDAVYTLRAVARGQGSALRAGVRAGARDVELRLGAIGAGIRGTVRDGSGQPITAFTVVAWPRRGALGRGPEERATVVDAQGHYELPLPPGSYVAAAAARGHAKSEEQTIDVADDAVTVDFTLRTGSRIRGRVVERDGGGAIAGARVSVEGDMLGDGVTLSTDAVSSGDGSFALEGLAPGRHSIDVGAGGHDSRIVSGLQVPPDRTLGPITIDLARVAPGETPKTELVGIGIVIGADESGMHILIKNAIASGGAAEAGLGAGDVILAVDGTSVEALGFPTAVQNIRGVEGSVVTLTVRRKDGSIQVIPVVRKRISN
jgi:carboxypeptidase family protein/PDZ domain-containing protein